MRTCRPAQQAPTCCTRGSPGPCDQRWLLVRYPASTDARASGDPIVGVLLAWPPALHGGGLLEPGGCMSLPGKDQANMSDGIIRSAQLPLRTGSPAAARLRRSPALIGDLIPCWLLLGYERVAWPAGPASQGSNARSGRAHSWCKVAAAPLSTLLTPIAAWRAACAACSSF